MKKLITMIIITVCVIETFAADYQWWEGNVKTLEIATCTINQPGCAASSTWITMPTRKVIVLYPSASSYAYNLLLTAIEGNCTVRLGWDEDVGDGCAGKALLQSIRILTY
jgi:hypothetical protein